MVKIISVGLLESIGAILEARLVDFGGLPVELVVAVHKRKRKYIPISGLIYPESIVVILFKVSIKFLQLLHV